VTEMSSILEVNPTGSHFPRARSCETVPFDLNQYTQLLCIVLCRRDPIVAEPEQITLQAIPKALEQLAEEPGPTVS
jgi:hypothetical protein